MILIVEGADLVGKSTLADRVAAARGWPVVKIRWALRGNPEIETRAMATSTIAILHATEPNVIFDRIYFSWWAYGPALGYKIAYMPEIISDFSIIDNAKLVLLTASEREIKKRFERNPDHHFTLEVIQSANERFPSLLPLLPSSLPYLHLDTTANPPDDIFAQVNQFLDSKNPVNRQGISP